MNSDAVAHVVCHNPALPQGLRQQLDVLRQAVADADDARSAAQASVQHAQHAVLSNTSELAAEQLASREALQARLEALQGQLVCVYTSSLSMIVMMQRVMMQQSCHVTISS
jgi:hypothetical protein